jgi:hypothetical protein
MGPRCKQGFLPILIAHFLTASLQTKSNIHTMSQFSSTISIYSHAIICSYVGINIFLFYFIGPVCFKGQEVKKVSGIENSQK